MVPGGFPGSAHSDVLTATPETTPAKLRLVEELKSRGKSAVLAKNWPDADRLYGKGIEVLTSIVDDNDEVDEGAKSQARKDLAIVYSNRSLSLFQINNMSQSRSDARSAVEHDPSYVKGYWRLGQACAGMGDYGEALEAYESAAKLDGSNKALKKEADKCRVKLEQERLLVMEGKFDGGGAGGSAATGTSSSSKKSEPIKTAATKPKPSSSPSTSTSVVSESSEFSQSDHVRGYKIVDGKKTSYFHNEMTEETKKLIGDIAPKKLNEAQSHGVAKIDLNQEVQEGASAWNKAGTWEERDVTKWAAETLSASLLTATYAAASEGGGDGGKITAKVIKATKMDSLHDGGHASVAAVRGKKRYIYEFGFELRWELSAPTCDGSGETMVGKMVFPDIDGTCEVGGGYDMTEFSVEGVMSNSQRAFLAKHIRDGGLRKVVEEKVDDWVRLFRATY